MVAVTCEQARELAVHVGGGGQGSAKSVQKPWGWSVFE